MNKLASLNQSKDWIAHDYGNVFFRQPTSSSERLVIGPSNHHVELMLALAHTWPTQQFYVLYVLLVQHTEAEPGRYASPLVDSFEDLQAFFYTFEKFLESDARHHVWIGSPANDGLLVYDQHNVVFAYGDLAHYEQGLGSRGFSRREFWFPSPHHHAYPGSNVPHLDELLRYFSWQRSPLHQGDEWN